jgi:glycosyltransferase involved in cell wall biosynthesis
MGVLLTSRKASERARRVLFVNTRDDLGADVAVHLLIARHLGAEGIDATFTVNSHAADAAKIGTALADAPDVTVIRLPLGKPVADRGISARTGALLRNLAALWSLVRLVQIIQRRRVDVLYATDRPRDALLCALLGRLTGRSTVIQMHSNYYPSISSLTRWAFRNCDCVVGVSGFTTQTLAEAGLPAGRLATVLNAIEPDRFDPERITPGETRSEWAIPRGTPLVGLIGRLIPYKGHHDLLEALVAEPALANVHALIVGDEAGGAQEYSNALRRRISELGLADRVHLTGFREVRPIYADLDVLVVPSWDEPFGLVVLEAMAMRVPVVAYRAGGIPEIIRSDLEGILVTPRAIDELSAALVRLISDPELRSRLGAAGRERVMARFTPSRQAAEVATLFDRVCGKKGHCFDATSRADHSTRSARIHE